MSQFYGGEGVEKRDLSADGWDRRWSKQQSSHSGRGTGTSGAGELQRRGGFPRRRRPGLRPSRAWERKRAWQPVSPPPGRCRRGPPAKREEIPGFCPGPGTAPHPPKSCSTTLEKEGARFPRPRRRAPRPSWLSRPQAPARTRRTLPASPPARTASPPPPPISAFRDSRRANQRLPGAGFCRHGSEGAGARGRQRLRAKPRAGGWRDRSVRCMRSAGGGPRAETRLGKAGGLEVGADQHGRRLERVLKWGSRLRLPCAGDEHGGGRTVGGHRSEWGASSWSLRHGVPSSAPFATGLSSLLWGRWGWQALGREQARVGTGPRPRRQSSEGGVHWCGRYTHQCRAEARHPSRRRAKLGPWILLFCRFCYTGNHWHLGEEKVRSTCGIVFP